MNAPPNADAKSGEPQDGKQEKDVVLAHDDAAVFGDRLTPCGLSPLQHLQCHGIVLPRQRVVSSRQGATGRAAQPHRRSLVSFQFSLTPVMVFAVGKPSPFFTCCSIRKAASGGRGLLQRVLLSSRKGLGCLLCSCAVDQVRTQPSPDYVVPVETRRPAVGKRTSKLPATGYDFMLNDADSVGQRSICSWNDLGSHQL